MVTAIAIAMHRTAKMIRCLALCLLAASCQSNPSNWEVSETNSSHLYYQAYRVSQKPDNLFRGMELEFVRTSSGTRAYLNVFSLKFSPYRSDESKSKVVIRVDQDEQTFLAHRLKGGQRLLLPENAQHLLIQSLSENKPLVIIAGRFDVVIRPGDFSKKHCQKMIPYEKK